MVSRQHHSLPLDEWDPAANFEALAALVNDDKVEHAGAQVLAERSVSSSCVGRANHVSVS